MRQSLKQLACPLARDSMDGHRREPGDEKLLAYLYNNKHATPFEMGGVVIEVKAPIFVFREWHRHRTQSYNEMSARYIPLPDENYIPSLERVMAELTQRQLTSRPQGNGKALTAEDAASGLKSFRIVQPTQLVYQLGINLGVPKELARLPVPVLLDIHECELARNLRNWLRFLTLRQAPAAQWEIREYANAVGQIIAERFPRTWELFTKEKSMSQANNIQHGGDHYKKKVIEPGTSSKPTVIGFLDGNAIKYLTRWKDKNGIEDLKKARHYIDKLIEVESAKETPQSKEVFSDLALPTPPSQVRRQSGKGRNKTSTVQVRKDNIIVKQFPVFAGYADPQDLCNRQSNGIHTTARRQPWQSRSMISIRSILYEHLRYQLVRKLQSTLSGGRIRPSP